MIYVYEALVGFALIGVCRWLWILQGRSRLGLGLSLAAVAAFVWPWAWYADWLQVARVAAVMAVVGTIVVGYFRLIAMIRRAAEERGDP